jgi:hypothetical protein
VLQRNVFSGGDADADAEDLIALPHLNEPAILEVRSRDHMTRRVTRRPPLCDATRPVQNAAPPRARALREEVDGSPLFVCHRAFMRAWRGMFPSTGLPPRAASSRARRRATAQRCARRRRLGRAVSSHVGRAASSQTPPRLHSPPLDNPPTPKPLLPGAPRARGTRPRLHAHRPDPARAQPMQGIFILVYKTLYLSGREFCDVNFSVFPVDARCGDVNFHRGTPSRGLEWAGSEAASATDPAGRRTVYFPTTLSFFKTDITYDTNLRHIQYLEVARLLCIWSWFLLNL